MPSPAESREALIGLTRLAEADLRRLWVRIANQPPDAVRDALMDLLPLLADEYGTAAAVMAADEYDELRLIAEAAGVFTAEPVPPPTSARFEALARWGVDPLFGSEPNPEAAFVKIAGGMQRTIADMHRETVVQSSLLDPAALGWRRVGQGDNCGFCNMLIGRGDVYSQKGVAFKSHDHCNCVAAAVFQGEDVAYATDLQRRVSQRQMSDATRKKNNQRAYEYIRDNNL